MDKNTIIGLTLVGAILIGFSFFNRPTPEEIEQQRLEQEELLAQQEEKAKKDDLTLKQEESSEEKLELIPLLDENGKEVIDSLGNTVLIEDTLAKTPIVNQNNSNENDGKLGQNIAEQTYILSNDKLNITFTNRGGGVKSVSLKNYQSYTNYVKNRNTENIDELVLFLEENAINGLNFKNSKNIDIDSRLLAFELENESENQISFVATIDGKKIRQIYSIQPDKYHINYEIEIENFQKNISENDVYVMWETDFLKSERLMSEQRRVSTVFYKENGGKYKYLSETKDEEKVSKTDVDWIAFKQSYFSAIMIPEKPFKKEGTVMAINTFDASSSKDSTHVKHFYSKINPGFKAAEKSSIEMDWFFGPNDYDLLKTYDNGTEDLLNYGWGLFRWMNIWLIQPLFVWLANFGMNLGIAILLLTVIIKLVLTPIQWKMYLSSAKMKILKPEIEEINQKYPNKDQAMQKQMEMMNLYKDTGSSPLAGCLPMLIQMPILFAVFRFFPSTFSLRQQSFLWAEDLSSYDSILDLGFNIPLYGDHVSLFTLLMATTTLFYTVMNSANQVQPQQPGMPNMKIIMYMMPIMMIFFFNNYSSGLSYYYFISTLMSILTMIAIKKFFVDEEKLREKMVARKASAQSSDGGTKKKSKFQQRLEEAQKLQQERYKKGK